MLQPENSPASRLPSLAPPTELVSTKWIVLSGGPSSGKTSLAQCLKSAGFPIFSESAVEILDAELAAGSDILEVKKRDDFSLRIAQIERARFHSLSPSLVHVFDTTCIDHFAYDSFYGRAPSLDLRPYAEKIRFAAVFLLDPVAAHERTGIRTETASDSREIAARMKLEYERYGYKPIQIPFIQDPRERVKLVLEHELVTNLLRG